MRSTFHAPLSFLARLPDLLDRAKHLLDSANVANRRATRAPGVVSLQLVKGLQ